MVSIISHPKRKRDAILSVICAVVRMGVLVVVFVFGWMSHAMVTNKMVGKGTKVAELKHCRKIGTDQCKVKRCREKVKDQCKAATTMQELLAVSEANKACFEMPTISAVPQQPRGKGAIRRCKHVFMDFGANIGDTSAHVVDSGMVDCGSQTQMAEQALLVHFDVIEKAFVNTIERNPLTENIVKLIEHDGPEIGTEDYCYYGVEGNPVFTERLRAIEDYVMAIQPKPIQHMHFFTESVGAGSDGPTKLYLDTVNVQENFWGSSILGEHVDVIKSADESKAQGGTGEKKAVDVMGFTIGKLMRETLQAFAPDATRAQKKGNHLILKLDIEGGEFPLLAQTMEDTTLCEFVAMGNKADFFIEFHGVNVTGNHPWVGKEEELVKKLSGCGVTVLNLLETWK